MSKTAVILAAGLGSRLGPLTSENPKGLMELEGKPILEWSIEKLIEVGVSNIVIGIGYLGHKFMNLKERFPQIVLVEVDEFKNTGSAYTLFCLRDYIKEDFLLLESDLIYEKHALTVLLRDPRSDLLLASDFTNSKDEVFIQVNSKNNLVRLSKDRKQLDSVDAELVGISKLSYKVFNELLKYMEEDLINRKKLEYEHGLMELARFLEISVKKQGNLLWCEIDDLNQLSRAKESILPQIIRRERILPRIQRNILLNPGPATTTDSIKYAQVIPDICPREKEFGRILQSISEDLTELVANNTDYTTVLFGGSGTAAVEAIISSVLDRNDSLLIINNGAYGQRMAEIAEAYNINYVEYQSPCDKAVDLDNLERFIALAPQKLTHLALVHNETTTGLLNHLQGFSKICRRKGIKIILDAMSSFAAIPIDMDKDNISFLAASSNKNLQGIAGVSFVVANKKDLERISRIEPKNYYLNLYSQFDYFQKHQQMRFTPPVQTIYALKEAIFETKLEGVKSRYERYQRSWQTLIKGLEQLNLKYLVKEEHHSRIITAILEPNCERYSFEEMKEYLKIKGYTIYPGKLVGNKTFRIANIGDIDYKDIEGFLRELKAYLIDIEYLT